MCDHSIASRAQSENIAAHQHSDIAGLASAAAIPPHANIQRAGPGLSRSDRPSNIEATISAAAAHRLRQESNGLITCCQNVIDFDVHIASVSATAAETANAYPERPRTTAGRRNSPDNTEAAIAASATNGLNHNPISLVPKRAYRPQKVA